jgi:hypothetical protein
VKKTGLASVVLCVGISGICFASDTYRPILVSLRPAVDIPLPPDTALFRLGAGAAANVSYVLPFFRPLSAGAGYFYAFQNHKPSSWAMNLVFSGRIGIGLGANFRLGGAKQEERR